MKNLIKIIFALVFFAFSKQSIYANAELIDFLKLSNDVSDYTITPVGHNEKNTCRLFTLESDIKRGEIIVYCVKSTLSCDIILTTSNEELNSLIEKNPFLQYTNSYATSFCGNMIYRLYNCEKNVHFYTSSLVEKNLLLTVGFRVEGVIGCSFNAEEKSETSVRTAAKNKVSLAAKAVKKAKNEREEALKKCEDLQRHIDTLKTHIASEAQKHQDKEEALKDSLRKSQIECCELKQKLKETNIRLTKTEESLRKLEYDFKSLSDEVFGATFAFNSL